MNEKIITGFIISFVLCVCVSCASTRADTSVLYDRSTADRIGDNLSELEQLQDSNRTEVNTISSTGGQLADELRQLAEELNQREGVNRQFEEIIKRIREQVCNSSGIDNNTSSGSETAEDTN